MFRTRSNGPTGLFTLFVRYGIGIVGVIAGLVVLVINPGGLGVDGFGLLEGAGLSVLMLNWMYRVGVTGDREREQEEEARRYLEQHGHWPGESPRPRTRPPNAGRRT
jgi:hypothetical protein